MQRASAALQRADAPVCIQRVSDTKCLERIQHVAHVVAVEQIADLSLPLGHCCQQQYPVGEALGAGQGELAIDGLERAESQGFHVCSDLCVGAGTPAPTGFQA